MKTARPFIPRGCEQQGRYEPTIPAEAASACTELGADDCPPGELIDGCTADVLKVYVLLLAVVLCSLLALHIGLAVVA